MNTHKTNYLLCLLMLLGIASLKSETDQERLVKIQAELKRRSDLNNKPRGIVFQPWERTTGAGKTTAVLKNASVRQAAELLAQLTQKEIFVSAKVETLVVSLNSIHGTRDEVAKALIQALASIDVIALDAGDTAIALILDKTQQPTE
jgi:hypothetical protein